MKQYYSAQKLFIIPFLIIVLVSMESVFAQVDTIRIGDKFEKNSLFKNSTHHFVHYREDNQGRKLPSSIKTISIERKGNELSITQLEYSSKGIKKLESIVDTETLATTTHKRTDNNILEAYSFSNSEITGIPSEIESVNKDFKLSISQPTYNFEIDFLYLQSIKWELGKTVIMNLYHPGGSTPPQNYTYEVIGSKKLEVTENLKIDTWVVYTDYNIGQPAKFWIDKETQEIIKQETDLSAQMGFKFYKVRIF